MELKSQVNTFEGGMNLDDDVLMLGKNQYRSAENVRLITNDFGTTGALLNIEHIKLYQNALSASETIIGTITTRYYNTVNNGVEECGIVVTKETLHGSIVNHIWRVTGFDTDKLNWTLIVSAKLNLENNLSMAASFESNEINKIYITDGSSNIKMINIAKQYSTTKTNPITNQYYFDNIPEAILFPVVLNSITSGTLKAGSVQYCFQLFTEHGTESTISPMSNVIPLSRDVKKGSSKDILGLLSSDNAEVGCVLDIKYYNTGEFDHIRIIRIQYVDNISTPIVTVINEFSIDTKEGIGEITYTDNGSSYANTIIIDELQQLVPYDFTAKSIETLHNRLFASNVKENTWDIEYDARAYRSDFTGTVRLDGSNNNNILLPFSQIFNTDIPEDHDCINPYNFSEDSIPYIYRNDGLLGGTGKNVSYKFVFAELVLSSTATQTDKTSNDLDLNVTAANKKQIRLVYEDGTVRTDDIKSNTALIHNYSNPYICANYLGYMRDEVYRFGIVFYNKKGIPSPVHWIGDIRMPSVKDATSKDSILYPFHTGKYSYAYDRTVEQLAYAMGIEFEVNNIPSEAVSWEIVRCDRTEQDRTIVSQGIISGLVEFGKFDGDYNDNSAYAFGENDIRPMPIANLGKNFYVKYYNVSGNDDIYGNYPISQDYLEFISPEVCVSKHSVLPSILNSKLNLLYKVSTYNQTAYPINDGRNSVYYLGYKQNYVDVVWSENQQKNDGWFGGVIKDGSQLYFHGGSGKGYTSGDARYWYEKQALFKYYNIEHSELDTNYQILDAIIGNSLPYSNKLSDSKNHAQAIGNKIYTNTSVAGYQQYSNHGVNCVMNLSNFNLHLGSNGSATEIFNFLNTTFITNIKRSIIPYGGNTYVSRQNSVYISCGTHSEKDTKKCICFGGDTYLNIFDYLNTSFCQASDDDKDWKSMLMNTVCYIPLESVVNTSLFSSESYHNTVNGMNGNNLIQNEPIVLGNGYTQQKPLYEYNTAYSVLSEALHYIPKSMYAIDDLHSMTRITCSELKHSNEVIDSWTKFKFANYLDVDSTHGPVTNLKVFKNKLYFFQDDAVGIASVNERSLITDNNPGELTLGTGGILVRYDYLVSQNGTSIVNDRSIVDSENAIYWYDFDKNTLCSLSNSFIQLSKAKKVQTYLNGQSKDNRNNSASFADKKYNEIWFNVGDKCVVFNEQLQLFTSYYTHTPDWGFDLSSKTVTIKNNKGYLHNADSISGTKENLNSYIQFVINADTPQTKTFDNQWFSNEFDKLSIEYIWFKTKTLENDKISSTDVECREDNYRFAIGREKVLNNQNSMSYAGRMRGKYLICNYTFDCNNNREFKLPYIKTTYRYSML